jgi:hypothetical protein
MHLCFRARDREAVREFHRLAVANGGRDDGAPGLRPQYHGSYYGAFVLDPDGHRIEQSVMRRKVRRRFSGRLFARAATIRNIGRVFGFKCLGLCRMAEGRQAAMKFRVHHICAAAILCALLPKAAEAQGYPGYPYSIMTPEHGAGTHRALRHGRNGAPDTTATIANAAPSHRASLLGREKFVAKLHRRGFYAARGSSGVVLPTPLPKTQVIPPEGGGALTLPPMQEEQGPTRIPGTARIIPNLPHRGETFQDRASRCTFQAGLYAVPGSLRNQYMGACVQ